MLTHGRDTTTRFSLEGRRTFFEALQQDKWDEISFKTPSGDGMLIARVVVVHPSQEILDWRVNRWLDYPNHTTLGCAAKITERKLESVNNSDHGDGHSCLFLDWIDETDTISNSIRFRTLDGNWGQTVQIVTRTVAEIDRVGKAQ